LLAFRTMLTTGVSPMFTVRSVMAVTRVIEIFHTRSLIAFDHPTPSIRLINRDHFSSLFAV